MSRSSFFQTFLAVSTICVLTGNADSNLADNAKDLGVLYWCIKPLTESTLKKILPKLEEIRNRPSKKAG